MVETRNTSGIRDLRTVGIPVVDQEKALAFYLETLGFEKRLERPDEVHELRPLTRSTGTSPARAG